MMPLTWQAEAEKIMCRRYAGQYIWGQLVSWYKQTIYSPEASLSADRRGVMSLPDPESAYGCPTRYAKEVRGFMLDLLVTGQVPAALCAVAERALPASCAHGVWECWRAA